jgi:hypothetical protein
MLYEREFIGVLLCLTEIKPNYFKDTDTQQDAFRKDNFFQFTYAFY